MGNQTGKLLGICGAEGAGKTTVANYLIGDQKQVKKLIPITNPEDFVIKTLFELNRGDTARDPVWHMTFDEAAAAILQLLRTHVDSDYTYPKNALVSYNTYEFGKDPGDWVEIALADPLKIISSVIFNMDCNMLMGKEPYLRAEREKVVADREYNRISNSSNTKITGRFLLEYLGTEVFRNNFDDAFWLKIAQRQINGLRSRGIHVVISDIRFVNEKDAIATMNGELLFLYRHIDETKISSDDKNKHPAKWHYKKFINCLDELPIQWYFNNGSKKDLFEYITTRY